MAMMTNPQRIAHMLRTLDEMQFSDELDEEDVRWILELIHGTPTDTLISMIDQMDTEGLEAEEMVERVFSAGPTPAPSRPPTDD